MAVEIYHGRQQQAAACGKVPAQSVPPPHRSHSTPPIPNGFYIIGDLASAKRAATEQLRWQGRFKCGRAHRW
jgi:hypothetical protein